MALPERTIERISEYRRSLLNCLANGKTNIFSHELAQLHHNTAVQVRRDIMFIGYSSMQRKGYDVQELIDTIGKILDSKEGLNVGVFGIGNLGMAITAYFMGKRSKLNIVAAFDTDPSKVDRVISGVKCYDITKMQEVIKEKDIKIGVITVPADQAAELAENLYLAGVRGLLNFTTVPLNISEDMYIDEYDMVTSLEKVAYFVKEQQ